MAPNRRVVNEFAIEGGPPKFDVEKSVFARGSGRPVWTVTFKIRLMDPHTPTEQSEYEETFEIRGAYCENGKGDDWEITCTCLGETRQSSRGLATLFVGQYSTVTRTGVFKQFLANFEDVVVHTTSSAPPA